MTELLRVTQDYVTVRIVAQTSVSFATALNRSWFAFPFQHRCRVREIAKAKIDFRKQLGHQDYLSGVHLKREAELQPLPFLLLTGSQKKG
jgi:hypothetical protein